MTNTEIILVIVVLAIVLALMIVAVVKAGREEKYSEYERLVLEALKYGIRCIDGDTWDGEELHVSFKDKCLFFEWDNNKGLHHKEVFYFADYNSHWWIKK